MRLVRTIRSIISSGWAVVTLGIASFLVILLVGLCGASHKTAREISRRWGRILARVAGVRVRVEGGDTLEAGRSYIFAANHQSQFDIPALAGFMKEDFYWMAKKELFEIPLFGRAMLTTGFIPIDRSHGRSALQSLVAAAKRIRDGSSVIIFPEGTRSPDGQLLEFKSGAMVLALKAGVPLVPVAIQGTHNIVPKGKLLVQSGEVIIRVGEPISTSSYTMKQKQELAQHLRNAVGALLESPKT